MAELETKLQEHDDWEAEFGNDSKLVSRRDDLILSDEDGSLRKELIDNINSKLEQYGRFIIHCSPVRILTYL